MENPRLISPKNRLAAWCAGLLATFLAVAALSSAHMASLAERAAEIRKTSLQGVEQLSRLQYDMLRYRQIEAAHALAISEGRAAERATLAELSAEIDKGLKQYEPLAGSSQDLWLEGRFADGWRIYQMLDARLAGLAARNDLDDASAFYSGEMRRAFNDTAAQLDKALRIRAEAARDAEESSASLSARLQAMMMTAMLLVLLLAVTAAGRLRLQR